MTETASPSPAAPSGASAGGGVLATQITVSAVLAFAVTVIWGVTGMGAFWPMWVWFGLVVPLAFHAALRRATGSSEGTRRWLEIHASLSSVIALTVLLVWALSGGGFFWPAFTWVGLGGAYWLHRWFVNGRQGDLAVRVEQLTRSRRGALDVQATELRRIERDLHDGAQARLVALSLQLARAEQRLGDQPETAALVQGAREQATAAIAELRDLARGIAPPVLTDRGLVAAAGALAARAPGDVEVHGELDQRLPAVVETAAYFVIAESLTNATKHAPGAHVRIDISERRRWLTVVIADDGRGGADPQGSGLTGLRQRVEALDGTLTVHTPAGGGTTITAALPCA